MCGKCESPLESKFHRAWNDYKQTKGIVLESQIVVPVRSKRAKNRRVDFGFSAIKLGVEIDSAQYHSSKDEMRRDRERERELKREGWKLVHLTGKQVYHYPTEMANHVLVQYFARKYSFWRYIEQAIYWIMKGIS